MLLHKGIGGMHGVQISGQNLLIDGRTDFLAGTLALQRLPRQTDSF